MAWIGERAALAQRMKADWCGFGAAERERQAEAVYEKALAASGAIGLDAMAGVERTVGAELLKEATQRVALRWAAVLDQRADPRSRAVAALLLSEYAGAGAAAQARSGLQALARGSHDPMVTALALQYRCAPGGCQNIDAAQWSRLEPANVQAWLALLDNGAVQTQTTYAMERIDSQASYSRGYEREVHELLLGLPQTASPGLEGEAEISILNRFSVLMMMPSAGPIVQACRNATAAPALLLRCEAVATRLWQDGDVLSRLLGVGMVRNLLPLRPGLRRQWEERARELDAVQQWGRQESLDALARLAPEGVPTGSPCDGQTGARQLLRRQFYWNAWQEARSAMREAGVDEAALATEWRRTMGRGSLDQPVTPASAASR